MPTGLSIPQVAQFPPPPGLNWGTLYSSLGTFWSQMFNEQGTVKGLTIAQVEETCQQYFDLVEALASYSVRDCPVFHLEKWLPVIVRLSDYNQVPFTFGDGAVFGQQPNTNQLYAGVTFEFGDPRSPAPNVYAVSPSNLALADAGILANRILNPSSVYNEGTAFVVNDGVIYFNFNIFDDPCFPKTQLIGPNGQPLTFTSNGITQNDQAIVLWFYCAKIDQQQLYNAFGTVFEVNQPSSETYKALLGALMNLHVAGPTISNIKSVLLGLLGEVPVQEQMETVEWYFTDPVAQQHIITTNVHVYRLPSTLTLRSDMAVGLVVYAGDCFSTTITFADNVTYPGWWRAYLKAGINLGGNILMGNYQSQLTFANTMTVMTVDAQGIVHFPVVGSPADVLQFTENLDSTAITMSLGLSPGSVYPVNPMDFIFTNFLRTGTSFLLFNIVNMETQFGVFQLFPLIRPYMPAHVWLFLAYSITLANDTYNPNEGTLFDAIIGPVTNGVGNAANQDESISS